MIKTDQTPDVRIPSLHFSKLYRLCVPQKEQKLISDADKRLVLHHIFKDPTINYNGIPLQHLATLFVLDADKKGYFDLDSFIDFHALLQSVPPEALHYPNPIDGTKCYLTWLMYSEMQNPDFGVDGFSDWIVNLVKNDKPPIHLPRCGDELFMHATTLKRIYELLEIQNCLGYDLQEFSDLLYETGIELGVYSEEAIKHSSFIPLTVIYEFAVEYGIGFCNSLYDCGIPLQKNEEADQTGTFDNLNESVTPLFSLAASSSEIHTETSPLSIINNNAGSQMADEDALSIPGQISFPS